MTPNPAPEPAAAPILPPSLRSYGRTGRSTVAGVRTRAACLPKPRRTPVPSTVPVGGCGSAWGRSAAKGDPLVLVSERGFAGFYFDAGNVEQHSR
jgi:hypothetical protein